MQKNIKIKNLNTAVLQLEEDNKTLVMHSGK